MEDSETGKTEGCERKGLEKGFRADKGDPSYSIAQWGSKNGAQGERGLVWASVEKQPNFRLF